MKIIANKIKCKKGFSIAEAMIATAVLVVGLSGILFLISNSVIQSIDSRNQIIASALAQEGVELARNARDNNVIGGNNAFSNIPGGFPAVNGNDCIVVYDQPRLTCGNTGYNYLLGLVNNYYSYSYTDIPTKFSRKINVEYFDSNGVSTNAINAASAKITSIVTWNGLWIAYPDPFNCQVDDKCVSAQTILTN